MDKPVRVLLEKGGKAYRGTSTFPSPSGLPRVGDSWDEKHVVAGGRHPSSCLGFSSLSAGMNFKARFALICEGHFDNCSTKSAADSRAGILVYLPPVVPGADAIIQEYVVVGTREIPDAP
jgi:hypothetical protein